MISGKTQPPTYMDPFSPTLPSPTGTAHLYKQVAAVSVTPGANHDHRGLPSAGRGLSQFSGKLPHPAGWILPTHLASMRYKVRGNLIRQKRSSFSL